MEKGGRNAWKSNQKHFTSKIQGRIRTWIAEDDFHYLFLIFLLKESLRIFSLVFRVSPWQRVSLLLQYNFINNFFNALKPGMVTSTWPPILQGKKPSQDPVVFDAIKTANTLPELWKLKEVNYIKKRLIGEIRGKMLYSVFAIGKHQCGIEQPEGWQLNCWNHWLSERLILYNYIPFACCFVYIRLPRHSLVCVLLFCVQSALNRVGLSFSERLQTAWRTTSLCSYQQSLLLLINKRKCVGGMPWRA